MWRDWWSRKECPNIAAIINWKAWFERSRDLPQSIQHSFSQRRDKFAQIRLSECWWGTYPRHWNARWFRRLHKSSKNTVTRIDQVQKRRSKGVGKRLSNQWKTICVSRKGGWVKKMVCEKEIHLFLPHTLVQWLYPWTTIKPEGGRT
jgi:hypothetical protein